MFHNLTALLETPATRIPSGSEVGGMSSNGTDFGSGSPSLSLIGERAVPDSREISSNERAVHYSVEGAWAAVATLMAAMARMQQEIDDLWRDAVTRERYTSSDRLVEASHALQRALRVLERDQRIG
jgi:hypothetical protein